MNRSDMHKLIHTKTRKLNNKQKNIYDINGLVGVYIGAYSDNIPFSMNTKYNTWVYMDCQPDCSTQSDFPKYTIDIFIQLLELSFGQFNMKLIHHDENANVLVFESNKFKCIYFYNSYFPKASNDKQALLMRKLLKQCTALFLKAYSPDKLILSMMKPNTDIDIYIYMIDIFRTYSDFKMSSPAIDFETTRDLAKFLLYHNIDGINYYYVYSKTDNVNDNNWIYKKIGNTDLHVLKPQSVEIVKVANILEAQNMMSAKIPLRKIKSAKYMN